MNIRKNNNLARSLTNKNNRHLISPLLKHLFLCLGILIFGLVLVCTAVLRANTVDNRSRLDVTRPLTQSPTTVAATSKTGMKSSEAQGIKQLGSAQKGVIRAAKRPRPRRTATRLVAPAVQSLEFHKAALESLASAGLKVTRDSEVVSTPASESSETRSGSTDANQTTAQKSAGGSPAPPSSDAKPRWIPPANRRGIVGTVADSNKPTATPATDPKVTASPIPEQAKDNVVGPSASSVNAEKERLEEINKREIREALKDSAGALVKMKGSEFTGIEPPRTPMTGKAGAPGVVAKPNAVQGPPAPFKAEIRKPDVVYPAQFIGDVRLLPQGVSAAERNLERAELELEGPETGERIPLPGADQSAKAEPLVPPTPAAPMPSFLQSFNGLNFTNNGAGWPPDTVGDVGPSHYVQAVNTSVGIFNKTGTQLATMTFNSLWAGASTGTPCDNAHQGDPTVIYSRQNDRWIVADFAWTNTKDGPYYECIAVSKTSNPVSGGWWLFAYRADDAAHPWLPDYPKMGIWPDGLYMSANMFDCPNSGCTGATYQEARAYAFNVSDLVNGAPLRSVVADTNSNIFAMLPSNYRGTPPPAGRENLFVSQSQTFFAFEVWKFHVDYVGSGSTFTGPTLVATNTYSVAPSTVPSPGTALDSLRQRLMMQNQYRNLAGVESLWLDHTTGAASGSTPIGIQWAQINVTGGVIVTPPVQQQIYNNSADGLNRWIGALAVDNQGNMALGYSVSSALVNPDIRYAGRLAGDPPGTLPQTEVSLIPGSVVRGTQSGISRWGDYSSMSIDPSDECTFWYTQEYYETTGTNWLTRIGSFKFPSCVSAPTEAKMKSFTADAFDDGRVLLRWSSSYESDNLGFNVYRESNGRRTKLNPQTIAGSALVTGPKIALTAGNSYAWADQNAPNGTKYWLEDIDLNGKSSFSGPAVINGKPGKAPTVEQSALLTRIGMASSQMTSGQSSVQVERKAEIVNGTPDGLTFQADLAGQDAVKIGVKREGWYRINQRELLAAGLNPNADTRNLQLYVDGGQVPIIVNGEQHGRLGATDSIEFYGVGLNSVTTNTHVYWLVAGDHPGSRIKTTKPMGGQPSTGTFLAVVERKDRTLYFAGLRNGETENFFGPVVAASPVDQSLTLTNLAATSVPAALDISLQGVTTSPHQARVSLNGTVVGTVTFSGQEQGKTSFPISQSQLREGANSVQLISLGGRSDISLVDTVRISYTHTLTADNNQLRAAVNGGQPVTIGGFTSSDIRVMDVTDLNEPRELIGKVSAQGSKSSITLTVPGNGLRTLLAFGDATALTAPAKANIRSNWRQQGLQYDYVIITTHDLKQSLNPIKALRESQGMSVAVIDVEDLYDEFSFGNKSPQAVKDFLRFTRGSWRKTPRFVLFAGDSSYDPKNYLGFGDSDLVPTKLYDSAHMEAASDDWFVDFESTGLPDIATGRLPVRNSAESTAMVAKILSYESSSSSNSVLLVSDLNDGHNFAGASAGLRALVPANLTVNEVVRGIGDDTTIKNQLIAAINQGNAIVDYNGHGSVDLWRGNILTNDDAASLTNNQKLAFFVIMTCLNGYFDDPVLDSLAESLMKSTGGASAVWASSAQCEPGDQEILNQELYRLLFNGSQMTVGEAAAKAKQAVSDSDVRRSWILFGDPAMRLK